jgi:hypothetical protein
MRVSTARLLSRLRLSVVGALVSAFAFAGVPAAWAGPGSWAVLAPVPAVGSGVEGMSVAATSLGRIVAAYGFDNAVGDTRRTRVYNIQRNVWTIAAQAPGPPRSEGTAVSRGTFVYSIGGRGPVAVLADLDRYDVWTNTWRSLADMPTARAGLGAAIIGPEIYAIGGRTTGAPCSGGELRSVERYDIRSNTWVRLAPLPTARSDAAAATVNG